MVKRRMPKVRDLAPLIRFRKPRLDRVKRRLDDAQTIDDLRRLPGAGPRGRRSTTPRARPRTRSRSTRARQAFRDIEFHPAILRDVSDGRHRREVLGGHVALPFGDRADRVSPG